MIQGRKGVGGRYGKTRVGMRVTLGCPLAEDYLVFVGTKATENFKEDNWTPLANALRGAFLVHEGEAPRCLLKTWLFRDQRWNCWLNRGGNR